MTHAVRVAHLPLHFPHFASHEFFSLRLDDVIDQVLDIFCDKLGFEYAIISLVDSNAQQIQAVRSKSVALIDPQEWIEALHYPLDGDNIQADVLRTGKIEIISRWDARLDKKVWDSHGHKRLARVFIPLDGIATIEAGFRKRAHSYIEPISLDDLRHYAEQIGVAIKNSQLYEREQQYSKMLTRLLAVTRELQTTTQHKDDRGLLQQIADAALAVLQASLIMLYPLEQESILAAIVQRFTPPIWAGSLRGHKGLKLPGDTYQALGNEASSSTNIVRYIAETHTTYYQPNAQNDPLLVGAEDHEKHQSFTLRQKIHSFAGVPLMARGQVLGVLCVNYRERRQFTHEHERNIIDLVAQQAAAVITSDHLTRMQERRRLEFDLHDSVKSTARALVGFSEGIADILQDDPLRALEQLHSLKHRAWGIRSDIDLILGNLAEGSENGQALHLLLQGELRLHQRGTRPRIVYDLNELLPVVPMRLARHLRWLLREAVWNALKHADSQHIWVSARYIDQVLHLTIKDDGQGFDQNAPLGKGHLGPIPFR